MFGEKTKIRQVKDTDIIPYAKLDPVKIKDLSSCSLEKPVDVVGMILRIDEILDIIMGPNANKTP